MRKVCLILMICLICLSAAGCAVTGEVENQAYALVMGVDDRDGGIGLTIRIPRIGQGGGDDGKSGGQGEPYLVISASGDDYAQALEHLQWATARELNLSHLRLLVVSEALSTQERFPGLIRAVAETRHLYTTAGFIVCEGRAQSFIEGQETLLGSHLSSDIDAMFRHYAAHGFIPAATVADLYYASDACYSDPVGVWGFPDTGEKPAAAIIEADESTLNDITRTASSRQYLGAALFRNGRLIGRLDGPETLCYNLLTRRVDTFSFESGGRAWTLSSALPTRLSVAFDGNSARLLADVRLSCADAGDLSGLEADIARDLKALILRCQALGVEPFGFAEKAAARFLTLGEWLACDWRSRFSGAEIDVSVHISSP